MAHVAKNTLLVISITLPTVLVLGAIYSVRWPLLLACIGIGIGVLIAPVLQLMQHYLRIPRSLGALLFFFVWSAMIWGLGYLLYYLARDQAVQFIDRLPVLLDAGKNKLADFFETFPTLSESLRKLDWSPFFRNSARALARGVQAGAEMFTALIYLITVSLYAAIDQDRYLASALSLVPERHHRQTRLILRQSASAFRHWFVSQLIAMISVGFCASIGFLLIGLQYWIILGALTAILDIVPFVGPSIAAICACLVTLGSDPRKVPWVILTFIIVEHIESNLVIPVVMKGRIGLPPVHLLTLMLIFAHWFGMLGVLIAPPALTILRTLYLMVYIPLVNQRPIAAQKNKVA